MLSIGDFARHGRVSVRMLRHYDAIGLLTPARVDPATGYRTYTAAQLSRLNRIVALKDLGFTLQQVTEIVDEQLDAAELRGMLRLRRTELQTQIEADTARLGQVQARLRAIESEGTMTTNDVVVKPLPALRVAELSGVAAGFEPESITQVIRPLFADLSERVASAELVCCGPGTAYYEEREDGSVVVHASVPVRADRLDGYDFAIVDLAPIEAAATVVHRGSMDDVLPAWQALGRWIDESGYVTAGPVREQTLEYHDDPAQWVTELQVPLRAR